MLANITQDILYSGSKGGVIKVWDVDEGKFNCTGTFTGHMVIFLVVLFFFYLELRTCLIYFSNL